MDLSNAATVGDVAAAINAASTSAGASVSASVTATGLELTSGGAWDLRVSEQGQGLTASGLGILQTTAAPGPLDGAYLQPKVTLTTPVDSLRDGAGIDKTHGLLISNGAKSASVDLAGVQTVQDILNAINSTGLGLLAKINDSGTGIDVFSRVSGGELSIGEQGGTTATDLGIRSMYEGTTLASLNEGRGVATVDGTDIRIVLASGALLDVNVEAARTVGDLIGLINGAGLPVTASLASSGNGICLVDGTTGTDTLRVERLNNSAALEDLGLNVSSSGNELVSRDVSIVRPAGVFTALEDLRAALDGNDTAGITQAASRISSLLQGIGASQGRVGALGQRVAAQQTSLGDAVTASKSMLSDIKDADYTEVITRFTQAQTIMQANLMTGSKLMQMSLMDFLQ